MDAEPVLLGVFAGYGLNWVEGGLVWPGLDARPHGFRSTLRVWLTESHQASREVAETIIMHQTGSLTERTYTRTDFLEQRRELMEAWERFLRA